MPPAFFRLLAVAWLCLPVVLLGADWRAEYSRLLQRYVTPAGVRYAEWKKNPADIAALDQVVHGIANERVGTSKGKEQLAFHLNAYNAWILHEALEKYPTRSVKDPLFTFFTANRITVGGEKMSFNHLEKDIIRPRFSEPRIHFALNCASRSCPSLRSEPYQGASLEAQLEDQTRDFINTPNGVDVRRGEVALSAIFDWYKEDFVASGGSIAYVNRYRSRPLPSGAKITFRDYDWSLNEGK